MDLENYLQEPVNEESGFLWNSLANKTTLCLMNFKGLVQSGNVFQEYFRSFMGEITCLSGKQYIYL
jgi:hypothetical protein